MRLRYLRLRDLPPLHDLAIPFAHQRVLGRNCAIRFVVGVNGSGKTRLLQALTETFLRLEDGELPGFPVTLAYDLGKDDKARTILLHHPGTKSEARLIPFRTRLPDEFDEWETLATVIDWASPPASFGHLEIDGTVYNGSTLPKNGQFNPNPLIVYTSGNPTSWYRRFASAPRNPNEANVGELDQETLQQLERPPDWTMVQEREKQQRELGVEDEALSNDSSSFELSYAGPARRVIFVSPDRLRLATAAAMLDLETRERPPGPDVTVDLVRQIEAEERVLLEQDKEGSGISSVRGLFNTVEWRRPLSLTLTLQYDPVHLHPERLEQLQQLVRVATEVLRPWPDSPRRLIIFDLQAAADNQTDRSSAQALVDAIARDSDISQRAFTLFHTLCLWQEEGLLENLSFTLRKQNAEELLLYDWLSDGERVFLGRMSLIHLLRGQDDALVLLDEPETHFNDIWKRRIVDIIDDNLRDRWSDVVISTHSSIALTDVFSEEIILLRLEEGRTQLVTVAMPTFGADPSEIMTKIFDAPDSIGQRASEILEGLLDEEWTPERLGWLEQLINRTGAGFYRSELRSIWRRVTKDAVQD